MLANGVGFPSEHNVGSEIRSWQSSAEAGAGYEVDGIGSEAGLGDLFGKFCGEDVDNKGVDFCFGVEASDGGDPGVSMVAKRSGTRIIFVLISISVIKAHHHH